MSRSEPQPPREHHSARALALAVVLIGAIILTYANSLQAPFLFDDIVAVVRNPTIRDLGSVAIFCPPADGSTTSGRPLVNASFALNHAVSGERVWSYHATNIALHAAAALALFGIVRRALRSAGAAGNAGNRASSAGFLIALLWALHPLQTESVTGIAQRTEVLCGFFYLLTLYGFVRGAVPVATETPRRRWLVVSIVSCLIGMATKEVMVTAPLVVLLYDRAFVAGSFTRAWRDRRSYYAALAATWLLLAALVIQGGGARGTAAGFGIGVSPWRYLLTQADALVRYLQLSLWPHPLVLDYGTATAGSLASVAWQALVVVALLAGTGWALARRPRLGFLAASFFVILAPSSSIVPLVTQTVAEHRMYLPLASVVAAIVIGVLDRLRAAGRAALLALAVASAVIAVARNHVYRTPVGIWTDTVVKRPENPRAHNNLGWALQQAGDDRANGHFARAVELQPDYVSALHNWGVALLEQGRAAEAIPPLESAVRLAPDFVDARVNLGTALLRTQRAGEALAHFEAPLRTQPTPDLYFNAGIALVSLRRDPEAEKAFRQALPLESRRAEAHYQLGRIAERAGRGAEAADNYRLALRAAPAHAASHARLGLLLAREEKFPEAEDHFRAVIRVQPDDADAHANLGNVQLLRNQPREAIESFERALRLRPNDARLRESLDLARQSVR